MACHCDACGGRMTGLHHIGIYVKDIEVSKAFYLDTLGFSLVDTYEQDETKLALVGIGSCVIELIQRTQGESRSAGVIDHIAIAVDDIDSLVCRHVENRLPFETNAINENKVVFGGLRSIFFSGPDGERLVFFTSLK